MASFKEKVASVAVEQAVKYARKDFKRNAPRILNLVEKFDVKKVNRSTYAGLHKVMDDPNNNWMKFAEDLICNMDEHVLTKLVPPLMNVAINSYTKRMAAIEKYGCNVPWAILMDPTAACNLKCTGCWAAEYGHTSSLSYDDLARIIKEGKELGTYMYLYTGGEPTMRRKDLMRLCRENPDCAFLSFTNGTLIDDSFADEIKEVGNFYPAFSIEGYEEENDFRRGQGTFKKCTAAMQRLKDRGVPFGASLCYTSKNTDVLASDEYMDWLTGGATLISSITGLNHVVSLLIFGAVVIIYTSFGGFSAVAITDTIQGIVMCIGTFLFIFFVLKAGGGLSGIDAGLARNLPGVYDDLFSVYTPGTLISFWVTTKTIVF